MMSGKKQEMEHWQIIGSKDIYDASPWIRVSIQEVRLPNGKVVDNFHRVKMPEYAVVVARTSDGRMIMERQYKHGVGKVSLMLPGGLIKPGEEPIAAARRELVEETGYSAQNWQSLGSFVANANYGCGKAHIFVAENAKKMKAPDSGDLEEMEIVLLKPESLVDAFLSNEIVALSAITAIALATNPLFAECKLFG